MATSSVQVRAHADAERYGSEVPMYDAKRMLYPMTEAAARLGIGRTTLYEIAKSGKLEIVHIGRKSLVPADSLNAYVSGLLGREGAAL